MIDADTGEELDGVTAYHPAKNYNCFQSTGWVAMSQAEICSDLGQDIKRVDDFRVLFALINHVEQENWITISLGEIAEELNMDRSNVSRSIKRLKELGLIIYEKPGRPKTYRLNPHYVWKGKASRHREAIKEMDGKRNIKVIDGGKS